MVYVVQVCWQLSADLYDMVYVIQVQRVYVIQVQMVHVILVCWQLSADLYDMVYVTQVRMVYVIQVCWQLSATCMTWHTPFLCVQWKTPDDGKRNCPTHVEFYSKNKFQKLVYLVGFIIRIHHGARSPTITVQGHLPSRCTVTYHHGARSPTITVHGHLNVKYRNVIIHFKFLKTKGNLPTALACDSVKCRLFLCYCDVKMIPFLITTKFLLLTRTCRFCC